MSKKEVVKIKESSIKKIVDGEIREAWLESYTSDLYSGSYHLYCNKNGSLELSGYLSSGEYLAEYRSGELFYIDKIEVTNEWESDVISWDIIEYLNEEEKIKFIDIVNKELNEEFDNLIEIEEYEGNSLNLDEIFRENFEEIYNENFDCEIEGYWDEYVRDGYIDEIVCKIEEDEALEIIYDC